MDELFGWPKTEGEQFVRIASELSQMFPDMDLRFNWLDGAKSIRCIPAALDADPFDIPLNVDNPRVVLYEAALKIKELGGLFDS